jgi:hypothetical protein
VDSPKKRCCCGDNSQHHAESVDVTPFTSFESVHDGDSTNNAASRTDPFPINTHFSSYGESTGQSEFTSVFTETGVLMITTVGHGHTLAG